MPGTFDDLIPAEGQGGGQPIGTFDDLIPGRPIEKTENLLQRSAKTVLKSAIGSGIKTALGPLLSQPAQIAFDQPQILPPLGQIAGGAVGAKVGKPFLGSVLGATGGKSAQELIEFAKEGDAPSLKDIGGEAGTTAALEAIFRIPAFSMLKRARLGETVKKEGALLGSMKDQISESARKDPGKISVLADTVLRPIRTGLGKIADPSGPVGTLLKQWEKRFAKFAGGKIPGNLLVEFESRLNQAIKFGKEVKGAPAQTKVSNAATNQLAKV